MNSKIEQWLELSSKTITLDRQWHWDHTPVMPIGLSCLPSYGIHFGPKSIIFHSDKKSLKLDCLAHLQGEAK